MKCALFVIDVQKAVFEMQRPVFMSDRLLQNINTAVSVARKSGAMIVFARHENKSFLVKGTPGHEIAENIDVRDSDIIIGKKHPDIFLDTGLDGRLKEEGIDTIIVSGLISNGCVREACVSALGKEYAVFLLSDAHSTFYKNAEKIVKDINHEMQAAGVKLLTVEQMATLFG